MRKVLFLFGQLDDDDVQWMAQRGSPKSMPEDSVLIREGEPFDSVYIVLDGQFEVTVAALGDQAVDQVRVGDILGEMSFVDSSPPSATVRSVAESRVLEIPRPSLAAKLEQDHGMAARFYRAVAMLLSDRLREARAQTGQGAAGDLEEDELDPNVLDHVSQAGDRFDRLLKAAAGR